MNRRSNYSRRGTMPAMETLLGVALGGLIAAASAILTARFSAKVAEREALARRENERVEKRYDDLRPAYVRFCAEMRELIDTAEVDQFESDGEDYADLGWDDDPLHYLRYGRRAERALEELRLFAGKDLYAAGRAWLDSYYARFWNVNRSERSTDVRALEDRVVEEGKRALNIPK